MALYTKLRNSCLLDNLGSHPTALVGLLLRTLETEERLKAFRRVLIVVSPYVIYRQLPF